MMSWLPVTWLPVTWLPVTWLPVGIKQGTNFQSVSVRLWLLWCIRDVVHRDRIRPHIHNAWEAVSFYLYRSHSTHRGDVTDSYPPPPSSLPCFPTHNPRDPACLPVYRSDWVLPASLPGPSCTQQLHTCTVQLLLHVYPVKRFPSFPTNISASLH